MGECSICHSPVVVASRFCSSCGSPLHGSSPSVASISTSTGAAGSGFEPGTTLAGRYRIIGLLGRGGMGEVYRADDLKLDQPVALKFIPEAVARNPASLAAFHAEVRLARQITHPNVLRVYDIGEIDGRHFLSMEFVDGEDLASLLRRIGRLPVDKAVAITRQVAAGLAAAHDRNVLHRDLKPGNVMIDGRGDARIADFGLAGLAGRFSENEIFAGTPAYMAPEQLSGTEVSSRSDLYALGLMLYEMVTGRRPFEAGSLIELIRLHQEEPPIPPSEIVSGLDPLVERVILRCLEKEPARRFASAMALSAALPGGDPLAAALAAGQTPSPEMVAAAGDSAAVRPRWAWGAAALFGVGLILVTLLGSRAWLHEITPMEKKPDVLEDRAQSLLRKTGLSPAPAHHARGFVHPGVQLRYLREHDPSPRRWDRLRRGAPYGYSFWYRQSPRPMVARDFNTLGRISQAEPPFNLPGMGRVLLAAGGQLLRVTVVPPRFDDSLAVAPPVDWRGWFSEAGLDSAAFRPVAPEWTPDVFVDRRAAWEGHYAASPDVPIRVEAGTYKNRVVEFRVLRPWDPKGEAPPMIQGAQRTLFLIVQVLVLSLVIVGGVIVSLRNIRSERADRKGAIRVTGFLLVSVLVGWLLVSDHPPELEGLVQGFFGSLGTGTFVGFLALVMYLAVEPYVRRYSPQTLITWTRLLNGRLRDPRLARDLLVGATGGVALQILSLAGMLGPALAGGAPGSPLTVDNDSFLGGRYVAGNVIIGLANNLVAPLSILLILVILRLLLRRHRLAVAALTVIMVLSSVLGQVEPIQAVAAALSSLIFLVVLLRFGYLAAALTLLVSLLLGQFPLTFDFSRWYAAAGLWAMAIAAGLVAWGLLISLGRPGPPPAAVRD